MNRPDVIEFFELHAKAATAEKGLKRLKPGLLVALQAGETSPGDLPYLLVLGKRDNEAKDYRTPLYRLLRRTFGKVRADKRMAQIEAAFEHSEIPSVNVRKNDAFAASLGEHTEAA